MTLLGPLLPEDLRSGAEKFEHGAADILARRDEELVLADQERRADVAIVLGPPRTRHRFLALIGRHREQGRLP